MKRIFALFLTAVLFSWFAPAPSARGATTREVCLSGCPYTSIQAAITDSANGDTVLVSDGHYSGLIDFLGRAITVRSRNGAGVTVINGHDAGTVVSFISGEGPASVFDGFTVVGGQATDGGGIR